MNNPKISIIIPVYNVEQYLNQCILSILKQAYSNFELILVDDGSTDCSGKICDEYADKDYRIKVIHKTNAGVSAARNDGIDISSGSLVCFIDSDDWIEENYLNVIVSEIEDFGILFFGSVWHYEDGCFRSMCFENKIFSDVEQGMLLLLKNDIQTNYFGFTWNKVFRKDIIDRYNIRFVEKLSISEDEIFTIEYCKYIKNMKIIDKPLYHYRWKKQGLTHKIKKRCDYLLLINSLSSIVNTVQNTDLRSLFLKRKVYLYNLLAWSNYNPLKIVADELKMLKFCMKNEIKIPIKSVVGEFINKIRSHDKNNI